MSFIRRLRTIGMPLKPYAAAAILAVLGQLAWVDASHAFAILDFREFNNTVRWSDAAVESGLSFAIAPNFDSYGPSSGVRNAFDTWSNAREALSFTESGSVRVSPFSGADIDVFMMPDSFSYSGFAITGKLALAIVATSGNEIVGADIYFNRDFAWSGNPGPSEYDVETVALHEIGHTLGLDHPDLADDLGLNFNRAGSVTTASSAEVMNSTIAAGEISRTLTADDYAGIEHLYPSPVLTLVSAGASSATVQAPEPSVLLSLALGFSGLLGFGLWHRRRTEGL